ncbi:MAG TPA: hypothetical protein VF609_09335, partial [Flavisolibacter sp.]
MELLPPSSGRQNSVPANQKDNLTACKLPVANSKFRHVLFLFLFYLLSLVSLGQAASGLVLTNAQPSALIDFSANTPSSAGTIPQTAFTAAGFSPDPSTSGRLNSNAWAFTGFSDGALAFGGTNTTGDYARGSASAAVSGGGLYAYTGAPASLSNPTLMIQPIAADFTPGTITLRIQNKGTTNITQLAVSYNLYVRNDGDWANTFNFSYSANNSTYTPVVSLNYSSPVAQDASGWVLVGSSPSRTTLITGLNIAPNAEYYLRWSSDDVPGGSGVRDELGLDDITIAATYVTPSPGLSINNSSLSEGNSNTKNYSFTVSISSPAP